MTRIRAATTILTGALLLVQACTWMEDDADRSPSETTEAQPQTDVATQEGPSIGPQPEAQDSTGAPPLLQAPTPAIAPSIEERLDRIAQAQEAMSARLDTLAGTVTAVPPGETVGAAAGEVIDQARQEVRSFGVKVLGGVIVIALFTYLIRGVTWLLDSLAERSATRRLFYKKLAPIVRIVLWVFAGYLIIRVIFQIGADGIFAAAAAVGVAVGFAAQELLKNLFGGLILVFDQPFQVGDKISVAGTYGEVVSIGLRSTRIVTPEDNLVSVPNAQVVDGQVANANAGELNCQVVTDLFLPGWIDESAAKKIAFQAAASSKYVYLNKPIVVLVKDEFKETFLTRIRVKAYVLDPRLEFSFQSDVTERARAGFREAGLVKEWHGWALSAHPLRGEEGGQRG
jgi:small-conductance mechanosensitive channel